MGLNSSCGPHGQDSMPGCSIRSRQATDASTMACRPVQTGCHRQTGSQDQMLLVESRSVSPATSLSRARRHVLQQPPYRPIASGILHVLAEARSKGAGLSIDGISEWRRQAPGWIPGGRTPSRILHRAGWAGSRPRR